MITKTWPCKGSGGCGATYSAELTAEAPADWTEDDWAAFMDAQSEHVGSHGRSPDMAAHIRKQMARTKRGDGFYKVTYSASENGSQTLCGAAATDLDMSWGDARFASNRRHVTCERCLELRPAS